MFNFFKVRRARTVIEQVGVGLEEGLSAMPPAERSAILAIANSMLLAAAAQHGKDVINNPFGLSTSVSVALVFELASTQTAIIDGFIEPMRDRGMGDVIFAQAMRQVRAVELVLATIGVSLVPEMKQKAVHGWKILWNARPHAADGVALLQQYASHSRSRPLADVPNMTMDGNRVRSLASSVPPFLRSKKPASVAKPARPTTKTAPQRREAAR